MQEITERDLSCDKEFLRIPEDMKKDFGLFNVFKFIPGMIEHAGSSSHHRKEYYKISLVEGSGQFVYAGEKTMIESNSIVFLDPQVPYGELQSDGFKTVYVCMFDQAFFHQYKSIRSYSVFQPGNNIFQLNKGQFTELKNIYQQMLDEIEDDYIYKYDLLRTLVTELVLRTIKMKSASKLSNHPMNASDRISILFGELLERQFPIEDVSRPLSLRSASDYAERLNIHVNHLNRALKEASNKTTSQLTIERILQEAKILLKQTSWTVSEIAFALGYTEATHFNNTFKKHLDMTPSDFRNS